MGEVPDWYLLIRSAKYLGVAPWDLLDQPKVWRNWARWAENAENEAERQKTESARRKKG